MNNQDKTNMDYEKAYKEALERAREYHKVADDNTLAIKARGIMEHIFPELAEEDDKKCRKEIRDLLVNCCEADRKFPHLLAWLEKQKEPKPIFRVGDTMQTWDEAKRGIKDGLPHIISIDSTDYLCNNEVISISEQGDYEFPPMNRQRPAEWSENESNLLDSIIEDYEKANRSFCGYDGKIGLLKAIRSGEYNLLKQEWSEEDEKILTEIINSVNGFDAFTGIILQNSEQHKRKINWLKSLRPQPHWKPSEEQMAALDFIITEPSCPDGPITQSIISLIDDLKKLM